MFAGKKEKNPLLELRYKTLTGENKLTESIGENEVTAVILDVGSKKGAYSLLVISDGTCSLYFEKGGGIIGMGEHKNVWYVSKILLENVNGFCEQPVSSMHCDFPIYNHFIVHILTKKGLFEYTGNTIDLPDGSNSTALFYLCNTVITQWRLLMEREYRPFSDDEILINFVKENNESAFDAALEDLNNPNAVAEDKSALLVAAHVGSREMVQKLISKGADIEYKDSTGLNPLMAASYLGKADMLDDLANENTLNTGDNDGMTPLMFACNAGKYECVKWLVEAQAAVNARDKDGSTPIMFAAQYGYYPIVKFLLEKGADKDLKGDHGFRAIDFAVQNKHKATAELLDGLKL